VDTTSYNRRSFLRNAGLLGLAGVAGAKATHVLAAESGGAAAATSTITLPFEHGERLLVQYPQKRPLIVLTSRALQLETPYSMFDEGLTATGNKYLITPNDAFYVRYHNTRIPLSIDPARYKLAVNGNVTTRLSLTLNDLKTGFTPVDVVAANMCTGNSRGFNIPRVPGGQWAHGAMGNALWTGVKLKDVLAKAGVGAGAVQVTFNGMDQGGEDTIPDFIKSLDVDIATSNGDIILAYAMNGADLPMLNGYPVRLVVPGYTGTYWVKHLTEISVVNAVFTGFYMGTAYREPDNDCACVPPGNAVPTPPGTRPVTHPRVRSFITNLIDGAKVTVGASQVLRGFAVDGGSGIKSVEISVDGGAWASATLGADLGKYSFRGFEASFTPSTAGPHALKVRATAISGEVQPDTQYWAPTGYGYNPVETVNVTAI
jgi:DMSO/TMAO reductase YedYZ molybdopterin-dependent catalytic subunit